MSDRDRGRVEEGSRPFSRKVKSECRCEGWKEGSLGGRVGVVGGGRGWEVVVGGQEVAKSACRKRVSKKAKAGVF